jgi:ribosomal-protein-alanine N-acetyltransferase
METRPVMETRHLILRPFIPEDAEPLQRYAGNKEISRMVAHLPSPYSLENAQDWIAKHEENFANEDSFPFAITDRESGEFMGSIELFCDKKNNSASLSYWMGLPFWNRGFCTEAAQAMIDFGFEQMGFHRIWAKHWAINTASGRIMEKCGMRKEGVMIEAEFRDGEFRDMVYYAILRREWEEKKA